MKINSALLLIAAFVLLRGCAAIPPPPMQQRPAPPMGQAPKPYASPPHSPSPQSGPTAAPVTRPVAAGWRDAAQTPGAWTYTQEAGGSAARFGRPGAAPLIVLRCDRTRPAVLIQRDSLGSGTLPAAITTSSVARQLSAAPVSGSPMAQNAPILFEIALNAGDPLLDAMAFSRGRFMLEMSGAPTLILPAWAEVGRVIEDCRWSENAANAPRNHLSTAAARSPNSDNKIIQCKTCSWTHDESHSQQGRYRAAPLRPSRTPMSTRSGGRQIGSTARKEVIRCLMVQQRGRHCASRSIIASLVSAIKASVGGTSGR